MIEQPNINQGQCLRHPDGDRSVGFTGLGIATRVVVTEDDSGSVEAERLLHDLPWVDSSAVNRAPEQRFVSDEPVPRVEEQTAEYFVGQMTERFPQEQPSI
jgi:hypothetical protein